MQPPRRVAATDIVKLCCTYLPTPSPSPSLMLSFYCRAGKSNITPNWAAITDTDADDADADAVGAVALSGQPHAYVSGTR